MGWTEQLAAASKQVDQCVLLAKKYVLPWWGKTLHEWNTPICEALAALYAAHECSEKWRYKGVMIFAPARFLLTRYTENGPQNLTSQKGGDDEVGRLGKHPYNVRAHFWMAQHAFWEGKVFIDPLLTKYGFAPFDHLAVYDQLSLLLLPRAIGIGCTRGLLHKASQMPQVHALQPVNNMEYWLRLPNADTTPFDGSQTTDVVMLRFAAMTRLILRVGEVGVGPLPLTVLPPAADPGDLAPLPKDFYANMQAYSDQAKREGPMPTGPWPV